MKYFALLFPFSFLSLSQCPLWKRRYMWVGVIWILTTFSACDLDELTVARRDALLNASEEVRIGDRYYQIQVHLSDDRNSLQVGNGIQVAVRLIKDSLEATDRWPTLDQYWVLNEIDEDRVWNASFDEVRERGGNQLEGISRGAPKWVMPSTSFLDEPDPDPLVLVVQLKDQNQSYLIKSFL